MTNWQFSWGLSKIFMHPFLVKKYISGLQEPIKSTYSSSSGLQEPIKSTYSSSSGLQEPIKSKERRSSDFRPEFIVHILLVNPQLVQHAHQEPVLLLVVMLPLIGPVLDLQLVEGGSVAGHLSLQGAPRVLSALYLSFSSFDLTVYLLYVLKLVTSLPKYFHVGFDLKLRVIIEVHNIHLSALNNNT